MRVRTLVGVCLAAIALTTALATGRASAATVWPLTPTSLVTDEPVTSMTTVGNHTYLTGGFSQIGTFTGSGAALSAQTGKPQTSLPAANGQISYVLASPDGGWYIGGNFTEVGGTPRAGLAKIDANGTLDGFDPVVTGFVDSLAVDGNSLFLGGAFSEVDGSTRQGLAAVNATTGALLSFDAHETGEASELCFLPATATTPAVLYAGMGSVLALDPSTGAPLAGFHSNISDTIDAMAVNDGHLYVGGSGGLVALDPMTGVLDMGFQATPVNLAGTTDFTGQVDSIVVQQTRILVGGTFNALGGANGPVVALDPNTGGADRSFRPQVNGNVYDMDQVGSDVWIGGSFDSAGGDPASDIAVVDAGTGARLPISTPRLNGQVNGIRVSSTGTTVFAGGEFDSLNAVAVHGFAEVDSATGLLDPSFVPAAPRWDTLLGDTTALVSAPLQFQGYDPMSKHHPFTASKSVIEVLSPASGARLHSLGPIVNLSGVALSGTQLYTDERTGNDQRFPHNVITVRSALTGRVERQFNVPLRGYVSSLLVANDGHLFASGSFKRTRPNGQLANLATIEMTPTGRLDADFDPQANGPIYSLAAHGDNVYFTGLFNKVWGRTRHGIGAGSFEGGEDDSFAPPIHADNLSTLTPLLSTVFVESPFRVDFLDYDSGFIDPFPTAFGLRTAEVTAAAQTSTGSLLAGELDTPLRDQSEETLFYVRTVGRS